MSVAIVMESVNVNTPSVTIEERKRKTREAVTQAQNNERDQCLKDLVNEKSYLEKEIERVRELCSVADVKQREFDLEKTYLSAEKAKLDQYRNLLLRFSLGRGI